MHSHGSTQGGLNWAYVVSQLKNPNFRGQVPRQSFQGQQTEER